jgi:hypothetical protein
MQKPLYPVVGALALLLSGSAYALRAEAAPVGAYTIGISDRPTNLKSVEYVYSPRSYLRTRVYRRRYVAPRYDGPGSGSGYGRDLRPRYDGPGSGSGYGRDYLPATPRCRTVVQPGSGRGPETVC